ncbi:Ppx/GppA phosphatase family protein [Corticibacterium sp. UT-5YL-CI-8]|nr:Ppx/GppA phosphatase family protein [Tianweitania sp. UT-5YL-CI-8]
MRLQRPKGSRGAGRNKKVRHRKSGAGAPGAGVSAAEQASPRVGSRQRRRRKSASQPGAPAPAQAVTDPLKQKKRRKRRRGRKVFANGAASERLSASAAVAPVAIAERTAVSRDPRSEIQPAVSDDRFELPVFAALDLGTNNCRLLVAVPSRPGQFRVIDAFSRIVRLGEGLSASGRLSQPAMDRAVEALKVCGEKLRNRKIRKARLVATEACRSAENGAEFIDRVEREAGLRLEIIDRRTEARLAVSGCGSLVDRGTKGVVLFDIGGGSSEIALIDVSLQRSPRLANHIVSWTSLPVGVVSLAERYGGRDVTPEIFNAMVEDVAQRLQAFEGRDKLSHLVSGPDFHLLGTSGTVTTLAGVHLDLERYDRRRVDGLWMDRDNVDKMVAKLCGWNFDERVASPCIGADRADLVLAGCAILEAIRVTWPSTRLRVADRGLREGILSELMADDGVWRRDRQRVQT